MIGIASVAMTGNKARPKVPVLFLLDDLPDIGHMRPIEEGIVYLASNCSSCRGVEPFGRGKSATSTGGSGGSICAHNAG